MLKPFIFLLLITLIPSQILSLRHLDHGNLQQYLYQKRVIQGKTNIHAEQKLHSTRLDHFRLRSTQTFNLRYWENQSYWHEEEGPIFLYLCGEWTCSYPSRIQFYESVAQSHQGNILVLQHRYYGNSQPFSDWSLDNMRYLSVNQALADVAHFIQAKNAEWGRVRKWIVIGGSYPGALSAWFRYKYPHLTVGAWSSSGVVEAITDFTEFDGQVRDDLFKSGEQCYKVAQSLTQEIENSLPGVKGMFQAPNDMPNDEFMWFIADVIALSSQYGQRTEFCEYLEKQLHTVSDLAAWAVKRGTGWQDYASSVSKSTTIDVNKNMRQWYYQMCSQMGFMQPGSNVNPVRSKLIDLEPFWKEYCKRIFGDDVWPDDDASNTEHGGNKLRVRNLIMMNGSEDPWKWASIVKKTKETTGMKTWLIECNDCGHCTDLKSPTSSDDKNLTKVRQLIADEINIWLK